MNGWEVLVESTLEAIHVDSLNKEIRIELTCAWGGKDRKRIVATGVDDFVVNEMRLSNIVDRVNYLDVKEVDSVVARTLFFLMRGREPDSTDLEWPMLKEKLECIRNGTLSLVEIESVYGATVIILAKDIRLQEIN